MASTPAGEVPGDGNSRAAWMSGLRFAPGWIWLVATGSWMGLYTVCAYLALGSDAFEAAFFGGWGLTAFQDALLIGYLPASALWARRQVRRTIEHLGPTLDLAQGAARRTVLAVDARGLRRGAAIGFVAGLSLGVFNILALSNDPDLASGLFERLGLAVPVEPRVFRGFAAWEVVAIAVVGSALWIFVSTEIGLVRRFSRLCEEHALIDLVELSPLRPITGLALGSAVRVVGVPVVASLGLLVVPEDLIVVAAVVASPALGTLALLGPTWGIARRIRADRREAVTQVRAELRSAAGRSANHTPERLADLIAHERRLEAVNPWLLDRRALLRFTIIVGAGMSMVGGALVERLLSALLE